MGHVATGAGGGERKERCKEKGRKCTEEREGKGKEEKEGKKRKEGKNDSPTSRLWLRLYY